VKGQHVLVTGGAGFIGSHLVDALLARGAGRVTVLDSFRHALPAPARHPANVTIARCALGSDPDEALARHLHGVDVVFHLAAEKHNRRASARELLSANVDGTHALFEQAGRAGVRKVVFASSVYVYGRLAGPPMVETEVPRPDTLYGITKLAGEGLAAHARKTYGLACVALRYFFAYGPRQRDSVITLNFERLRRGEPPVIVGDGRQALDYVYVDDVVDATIRAMEADADGDVLNVGSGTATAIEELTAVMTRVSGRAVEPLRAPPDWTAGSSRVADVGRARAVLGWQPSTPLIAGLERTWRYVQDTAP